MKTPQLPDFQFVEQASAVVAAFGQFNLYDAEIPAFRFAQDPGGEANLDIDLLLGGVSAHRITLRCDDVADLTLDGFARQNVVGNYRFARMPQQSRDGREYQVSIEGTVGGSIDLRCRRIRVTNLYKAPEPSAG